MTSKKIHLIAKIDKILQQITAVRTQGGYFIRGAMQTSDSVSFYPPSHSCPVEKIQEGFYLEITKLLKEYEASLQLLANDIVGK